MSARKRIEQSRASEQTNGAIRHPSCSFPFFLTIDRRAEAGSLANWRRQLTCTGPLSALFRTRVPPPADSSFVSPLFSLSSCRSSAVGHSRTSSSARRALSLDANFHFASPPNNTLCGCCSRVYGQARRARACQSSQSSRLQLSRTTTTTSLSPSDENRVHEIGDPTPPAVCDESIQVVVCVCVCVAPPLASIYCCCTRVKCADESIQSAC